MVGRETRSIAITVLPPISDLGSLSIYSGPLTGSGSGALPGQSGICAWPGAAPDALPVSGPEYAETNPKALIGGRTVTAIERVSQPTLTLYRPR